MIEPSIHSSYFFSTERPSGYEYHPRFFYSTNDFLSIRKNPDKVYFLFNQEMRTIVGFAWFYELDGGWESPYKSPFGGFDFIQVPEEVIREFTGFVLGSLPGSVDIRLFPEAYAPAVFLSIHETLISHKFEIKLKEPNHHIVVSSEPFDKGLHAMELRKLKSSVNKGLKFKEEELPTIGRIYDFIRDCRDELNYNLSLTREEVIEQIKQNPGHYHLFSVYDGDILVAATIAVVVNEHILYNFYPASSQEYKKFSPAVLLNKGIYEFCQDHGYAMLDLGTSFMNGKPNQTLISFKEKLGAKLSYRKSYYRQ